MAFGVSNIQLSRPFLVSGNRPCADSLVARLGLSIWWREPGHAPGFPFSLWEVGRSSRLKPGHRVEIRPFAHTCASVVGVSVDPLVVGRDWSPVSSYKTRGYCRRTMY
jgi:hypothetical protein